MVSACTSGGLVWILGKKIFSEGVSRHWNRELLEPPSLEAFKRHGGVGLMIELDELRVLF